MATIRTVTLPLLLFAFALVSGVLLEGVYCDFASRSRREAMVVCPKGYCHDVYSSSGQELPNCCVNPANDLFCTNLKFDSGSCGYCGIKCSFEGGCCNSQCVSYESDPTNCGGCGYKHVKYHCSAPTPKCVLGKCTA